MANLAPPIIGGVRRAISQLYTSEYLKFDDAALPTGVPGLGYFDSLFPNDYPASDVRVLGAVLRLIGFAPEIDDRAAEHPAFWETIIPVRMVNTYLAESIRELVILAATLEGATANPSPTTTARLIGLSLIHI